MPAGDGEEARAAFLSLVPEGFEEAEHDGRLDLVAYVEPERGTAIRARFPSARTDPVQPGWEEAWKAFHRSCLVGSLWIGPPWEEPPASMPAVIIDPGRAFGTGAHPTTRLCLELLGGLEPRSVLDCGCGSGVLAIAAARLGCPAVTAVDLDPAAIAAARANARANGVRIRVQQADVLADPLPPADAALANLELRHVEPLAARLRARWLIASGYPPSERPAPAGWTARARRELDGWAADLFERDV